ncbi:acyl-CoA dehydrogenase family protein [Ketobacter sp.]|uniref:acyl-CoA dehydrogenase family protein n=1 Tax=Ketobacter sp. TaxID=2083498 RepID=UPI000F25B756|nr:acyl-CoA dehydrogenase [Ketobacter sp.]RLT92598.1 MAG: pimeloyl-CoA dehydrogenase small subunit [Ketobacter sp.]
MNFNYSEEQTLLKDSVSKFIHNDYDYETRKKHCAMDGGFDAATWQTFAELGWLCVPFSEEDGGIGGGALETMIMMEEFGKGLVVEPYVSTVLVAGAVLAKAGSAEQKAEILSGIIDGSRKLALAAVEPQSRFDLFDVTTQAAAEGDGYVLSGRKTMVMHGAAADTFIVSARTSGASRDQDGVSLFLVPADSAGLELQDYPTLDGHRAAELTLNGVKLPASSRVGDQGAAVAVLEAVADEASVALCAEAVGMMEKLYRETVEYSKNRKQFGVPISVFQALQHRMVDMFTLYEECKSLLLRAVMSHQAGAADFRKNVSALKYAVAVKGQKAAHEAVQIFGGMGMTDEMSVGMYLKRINVINTLFGNGDYHLKRFMSL